MEPSSPGKSLVTEVEKLREAVLQLCDLQQELAVKVEAALTRNPITDNARPSDCERRLKSGAQAHNPPAIRRTPAEMTMNYPQTSAE